MLNTCAHLCNFGAQLWCNLDLTFTPALKMHQSSAEIFSKSLPLYILYRNLWAATCHATLGHKCEPGLRDILAFVMEKHFGRYSLHFVPQFSLAAGRINCPVVHMGYFRYHLIDWEARWLIYRNVRNEELGYKVSVRSVQGSDLCH